MTDQEDAKRMFFTLVSDARAEERMRAYDSLVKGGDEKMALIARLGLAVSRVVTGGGSPSALKAAFEDAGRLPKSSRWNAFIETAAQVLARKGLGMEAGDARRETLAASLHAFSIAMGGGMPISEFSIGLVRETKAAEGSLSGTADSITMMNQSFAPERGRLKEERDIAAERRQRKKIAGS